MVEYVYFSPSVISMQAADPQHPQHLLWHIMAVVPGVQYFCVNRANRSPLC